MALIEPSSLHPVEAFARLRREVGCCWLDSGEGASEIQRYSILAARPSLTLRAWGPRVERITKAGVEYIDTDSLAHLEAEIKTRRNDAKFAGGAVGHFSYEFGRRLAGQCDNSGRARHWPDFHFQFYSAVYVFNHEDGVASLRATDDAEGQTALNELMNILRLPPAQDGPAFAGKEFTANRSRENYTQSVSAIRESIAAGDIYQANLAQFFSTPFLGDSSTLYNRLRRHNPAPYSIYLDQGSRQILSSSPEMFLRVEGGRIITRPIKGTRPRGETPAEDDASRDALLESAKERAELLMIVDMERNDLGRIAEFGSVKVNKLYQVESYATVHHLIGEVEAQLKPGVTLADLLRATFPGGSITGAPKLMAMEIIAHQEPSPRDVFCGAIGWLGFNGDIDLNIAIRTITCQEGRADFGVGAGIVWDSEPEAEYEETLHKAKALFAALSEQ
ncbi:aminodeoxychorismate synthase component I [Cerasicoccus fimbriatus]|uniref:aminodeoxychorismate synthase component I n=1 Tax=Cerasicoccus fimbriatus TaxID=3014554 RepID=UPI0022B53857|nr:aminodeoxychorismate synthase component I [Cerasicoccus sp. TK19100]